MLNDDEETPDSAMYGSSSSFNGTDGLSIWKKHMLYGYYEDSRTVVCYDGFVTSAGETGYNVTCGADLMFNVSSACQSE